MYKSFMITESLLHNPTVHVFVNLIAKNSFNDGKENTTQYKPGMRNLINKIRCNCTESLRYF